MWTQDKGLEMGPIDWRYEERLERGGAEYEGVNLHHLCASASYAIGRVNRVFRDILSEAYIIDPSTAVKDIDPKTLSTFRAHLEDMEELEQLLESATQQLDQVIYITRDITKNLTKSSIADVHEFEAYKEMQLLWETKHKMVHLLNIKHKLTVISSALEALLKEQVAMMEQYDQNPA